MKTISVCSGRVCFATPSRGSSALYGRLRSYVHIRFLILVKRFYPRSANSLDALLTAAQAKAADIEVIYEQLFERFKNLRDCDIRILDLLPKDKCTQEDYDKGYNACELHDDKFITYKIKVKNILAGKAQGADVQRFTDPGTKLKLPNFELPTFEGNPRDWLNFWTQFIKIHNVVNIDDLDKFQYLIQSTAPSSSHKVALCKSSRNCPNCSKRHNSLLCRNFERNVGSQRSPGSKTLPNMEPRITTPTLNVNSECFQPKQTVESFENGEEFVGYSKGHSTMLLSTAVVYCQNSRGEVFPLRALLDSGSQSNLIPHEAALALGLKCERVNTSISGVNGTLQFIKNKVSTVVSSKNRQFQKLMEFLVVPKITGLTPTNKLDISGIKIPEYIKLSNENFYSPGRVDLLLSNQIFFEILNSGKLKLADGKLILQDRIFGYVASGVMSHNYTKKNYCGLVTNAN
ncbi:DUF1758 domain-containing protein [Trichonephila clavipes]|nr:DUF1758 domain-containing protein [Trichonephila clavipes]